MMHALNIMSLFCEDIREEKSGINTLIGIFPDNILIPQAPIHLPKLSLYIRVSFRIDHEFGPLSVSIVFPDGSTVPQLTFEPELIEKARTQSRSSGIPVAGLIGRAVVSPFEIRGAGLISAIAHVGSDEGFICGVLNVRLAEQQSNQPSA